MDPGNTSVLELQKLFAELSSEFILWLRENGYEVTYGETYRPPETAALYAKQGRGVTNSLHCWRLAIDLNLFRNGKYLTTIDGYRTAGAKWKSMHSLCRWGGDFQHPEPDPDHFSLEWEGRA